MHNFGKLAGKKVTYDTPDGPRDVMELFDANDVAWHDLFPQFEKFDFYLAVDDDGVIISCEDDPEHSQIGGYSIIGVSAAVVSGFTRGERGTIYGAIWNGTVISPKPPVLVDISDRQFFQQLAVMGLITQGEALVAVKTGEIPAAMAAFINALPADQQFEAQMVLCGATTFSRSHPLVSAFGAGIGMTDAQIDQVWIAAAQL